MASDSPVTVVPQLQFLSEKPIRRTTSSSKSSSSKSSSSKSSSSKSSSSATSVNANRALRGTTTTYSTAAPTTAIGDKSSQAVAEDKAAANIGTSAEADPLSHAIRVLLYRLVFLFCCRAHRIFPE